MHCFADHELARRLELLAAEEMRRFVRTACDMDPFAEAALLDVAGGVAAYLGAGSPVNQSVGLGFAGPVDAQDIRAIEAFFCERSQRGLVVLSPLADHSVLTQLGRRGWRLDGFENLLVRSLADVPQREESDVEIVHVSDDEHRDLWGHIAAIGFSAPLEPLPEQLALGRIVSRRPGATLLLALVDGRPAGTGELYCEDGVAWLSADATLPHFRRRGVQRALQLERLRLGADAGCELAVSEALPGSASQRNMERLGFRVAYTRSDLVSPVLSAGEGR